MYDALEYRKDPRMPVISSPEMVVELSLPRGRSASVKGLEWPAMQAVTPAGVHSAELCLPHLQELTQRRDLGKGLAWKVLPSSASIHAPNAFAPNTGHYLKWQVTFCQRQGKLLRQVLWTQCRL